MGWSSGGEIFDGVAGELVRNEDIPDGAVTAVLVALIRKLCDADWDTLDESIMVFRYDAPVMAAFEQAAPDWLPDDYQRTNSGGESRSQVETRAWRMLLSGAESYLEDAICEDEDDDPDEHDAARDRAMELVAQFRHEKGVPR